MMMARTAGVALAFALMGPAAASAAITLTTYTGYVESGFDGIGLFHVLGGDLTNQRFTVTYRVDDSVAAFQSYVADTQSNIEGGYVFPSASPVSAVFTLNHVQIAIQGLRYGYARGLNIPNYVSSLSHNSTDYTNDNFGEHGLFVSASIFSQRYSHSDIPADYHAPYTHTLQGGDGSDGLFNSYGNDGVNHAYTQTLAVLRPTSVITSGVPEPSAWALMILGVSSAGAMIRRRRCHTATPG